MLIEGETGSGKELAAQRDHREYFTAEMMRADSACKSYPFALPPSTIAGRLHNAAAPKKLFGCRRASTGSRRGGVAPAVQIAHGRYAVSMIGEMPPYLVDRACSRGAGTGGHPSAAHQPVPDVRAWLKAPPACPHPKKICGSAFFRRIRFIG